MRSTKRLSFELPILIRFSRLAQGSIGGTAKKTLVEGPDVATKGPGRGFEAPAPIPRSVHGGSKITRHPSRRNTTQELNNHNDKAVNMNNRFVSLISIITFFAGPMACSDAGGIDAEGSGRDTQALSASGSGRELETESPASTNTLTFGASPTNSTATGASSTGSLTLAPEAIQGVIVDESERTTTLSPSDDEEREIVDNSELSPGTITWGSEDAGVEIRLGVDADEACAHLRSACLSSGETEATCAGLVEECEAAVANPSSPSDSVGFVTDCDEMGASCRAAGAAAEECDRAVAVCKSGDAGVASGPASIVGSCEELRATCEQAGLTDAQCDEAVAACNEPAPEADTEVGLATDCAAVLASCLSYGIPKEECEEVRAECEGNEPATEGSSVRLK